MANRVHSGNKVALAVNSVLQEIDFSANVYSPKELAVTLMAEIILFATLKASINRLIKKSKENTDLSREISSIALKKYSVRVVNDERVFSFEDGGGTIWISTGLEKLLDREELIAIMLHEIGHGKEKIKVLYDRLTKNPERQSYTNFLRRDPKKLKPLFAVLSNLIKSQGFKNDPMIATRVYFLTYIMYVSLIGNPFSGLYKWSYGDLAVQYGYWDQYESALDKINRYIVRQEQSKLANKIADVEEKSPGAVNNIQRDLHHSAGEQSDNIEAQAVKLSKFQKTKPNRSIIGRFLRSIF